MDNAEIDQIQRAYEGGDLAAIHRVTSAAILRNPSDWQAHYHQGQAFRYSNKFKEAAEAQRRALKILQSTPNPDKANLATVFLALGIAYQLDEKLDEAAATLSEGTRHAPTHSTLWNSLGLTERKRNNYAAAIAAYEKGLDSELRHATDDARSKGLWGVSKREDGSDFLYFSDKGFGEFIHERLQQQGLFTKLLANRARVHVLIGERDEAILGYVRALTFAKDPDEATGALDALDVEPSDDLIERAMERNAEVFMNYVIHRAVKDSSS